MIFEKNIVFLAQNLRAFVSAYIYRHIYGVNWSLWGVTLGCFFNFSKILIFCFFSAIFGSKLSPKLTFSLSQSASCSGCIQGGF